MHYPKHRSLVCTFLSWVILYLYLLSQVKYVKLYLIYRLYICIYKQGRRHRWGRGSHGPPTFLRSKKKKGRQREKRKSFKAEAIKRLSPRLKYYCFNHSGASRIRKFFLSANHGGRQYFSVFHGSSTLKSISPALIKERETPYQ